MINNSVSHGSCCKDLRKDIIDSVQVPISWPAHRQDRIDKVIL
ncbi:hypothetical protein [Candidatus Methanoperedens sp. BLZ2]|nr:hypothetical protein [Candidatus Methanoperedens sp. BLZ2]